MTQQVKAFLISYVRLFVAAAIACYLTLGKQPLDLGSEDWKAIFNAALAALALAVFNFLNPADKRYGIKAPESKELSAGDVATNTGGGV